MTASFHRLSISAKLRVVITLSCLGVIALTCITFFGYQWFSFRADMVGRLTVRSWILAENTSGALAFRDANDATSVLTALRADPESVKAIVFDGEGQPFAHYPAATRPDAGDFRRVSAVEFVFTPNTLTVWAPIEHGSSRLGTLMLQNNLSALDARLRLFSLITVGVMASAVFIAFLGSKRLQRLITRPVLELAKTARAVTETRDYSRRARRESVDEIGALTDDFNTMLAQVQERDASLRRSEVRFRSLVTASSQIIWNTDALGKVNEPLPSWQDFTGQSEPEILRGEGQKAIHPDDRPRVLEAWAEALQTHSQFEYRFRLRRSDGVYRDFVSRGVPIMNDDGTVREWIGTCTDITERNRADEEIHRLNTELEERVRDRTRELEGAVKELEAFSYSVSHDLRAPLRAMAGFSRILADEYSQGLPPDAVRYLNNIQDGARRMGGLIDDLLAFSRLSRQNPNVCGLDLTHLFRDVASEMAPELANRSVQLSIGPLTPALGDPALLRQVIVNLLSNALKYSRTRDPAVIEVGETREHGSDTPIYYVRDNGVGFDMKYAGKLFGVFQRLHRSEEFEGTGVGLAITQRVIHRHGGQIWAESTPDAGATFFFTLKGK